MRLWHKDLIPILPRLQLVGQWRECRLIARKIAEDGTPNHLLVNKILNYPLSHFATYAHMVREEMLRHGYNVRGGDWQETVVHDEIFKEWHNNRYMYQCLFNLQEKYDCGGIPKEEWDVIREFIVSHYDDWDASVSSSLYLYK